MNIVIPLSTVPIEVASDNKPKVMAYEILSNERLIMVTAECNTIPSVEANNWVRMCWLKFHSSMSDSLVWKGTEFDLCGVFHQPIYRYNLWKLQALALTSVRYYCWNGAGLLGWMKFGSRPMLGINSGCSLYWYGPAWYSDRKLLAPKLFMLDDIWIGINITDLTVLLTIKLVPDIKNINYHYDWSGIFFSFN